MREGWRGKGEKEVEWEWKKGNGPRVTFREAFGNCCKGVERSRGRVDRRSSVPLMDDDIRVSVGRKACRRFAGVM